MSTDNSNELDAVTTAIQKWEFWELRARTAEARVKQLEDALAEHKRTSTYPDAADGFLWDVYLGTSRMSEKD